MKMYKSGIFCSLDIIEQTTIKKNAFDYLFYNKLDLILILSK